MTNAKEELLFELKSIGSPKIKCAAIMYWCDSKEFFQSCLNAKSQEEFAELERKYTHHTLTTPHTEPELNTFFESLNFDYDSGHSSQVLFGTVWLEDGTWLDRHEYDGAEWWVHRKVPTINDYLKKIED